MKKRSKPVIACLIVVLVTCAIVVCGKFCFNKPQALCPKVQGKTICLNMIVKNESKVIARCLASCKDIIDYWVIVDTGSTDGTQEIIREELKGIPGELHERSWINFGHNRNEALMLAKPKADYTLFFDADEQLVLTQPLDKTTLTKGYYFCIIQEPMLRTKRLFLTDNQLPWEWVGAMHETLVCGNITFDHHQCIEGVSKLTNSEEGHRSSDPNKYLKDAAILEQEYQKNPTNTRNLFHLAQCYYTGGRYDLALKYYEERSHLFDDKDERWFATYMVARIRHILDFPTETLVKDYLYAFQERPYRAEPLFHLAFHYFTQKDYISAYLLAEKTLSIPMPDEIGYVETWLYDYGLQCLYADVALILGLKEQALVHYKKALTAENMPETIRKNILVAMTQCK